MYADVETLTQHQLIADAEKRLAAAETAYTAAERYADRVSKQWQRSQSARMYEKFEDALNAQAAALAEVIEAQDELATYRNAEY